MFEFFFGNPKRKAFKDYKWLQDQLAKEPYSQKELNNIFDDIKKRIKDLNKQSLRLYLKDENIIKKCKNLSPDILNKRNLKTIEARLKGYESKYIRVILDDIIEAIDTAREIGGSPSEIFKNFKQLVDEDITTKLPSIMNKMIEVDNFLEHIHLSHEEIEFYTMKKRGKTQIFPNVEVYLDSNINYILIKINNEVEKHIITGSETAPNNWYKHIKLLLGLRYKNGEAQFSESVFNWKEVLALEEKALEKFKGYFNQRNKEFRLFFKFDKDIGITDIRRTGDWKKTKIIAVWFKPSGRNYAYHGYPADSTEVRIENQN
ncbi:hypothetical protein GF336_04695 [Candidatus Woesearchaeota archaeon]|nr:hypothetical protein [Candidatus Woesearchaeota archaeon]